MQSSASSFLFSNRQAVTEGIHSNINQLMGSNHLPPHVLGLGLMNPSQQCSPMDSSKLPMLSPKNTTKESILKTPVSLLNEVCAKAKVIPVFQTTEEGPPHERTFECIVKVEKQGCSWEGKGQARAKRDAKQEAAKALLISMDEQVQNLLVPSKSPVEELTSTLEYDPEVTGNPVGELNDLCLKIKRLPPEYEETGEEGRPHERVYTITCKLGTQIIEQGRGRSKKHAKKVAAFKVKQRLIDLMVKVDGINTLKADEENIVDKIQALALIHKKQAKTKPPNESWSLADWLNEFKERSGDKLLSLQTKPFITNTDHTKLLRDIAEEQKFKVEYVDTEKLDSEEQFFCVVSIGIEPVAIFLGCGDSKTQARKNAAAKAIEFLRIAVKK